MISGVKKDFVFEFEVAEKMNDYKVNVKVDAVDSWNRI